LLELSNITVSFNQDEPEEMHAIKNLSLQIDKGEFIVIVGANGSGKSTLLSSIAGNVLLYKGRISLRNRNITLWPEHKRCRLIARVFQNPFLGTASDLTILENFRLASIRTSAKKLNLGINSLFRKKVADKISVLDIGLENKLDKPMGILSGGQRQALTLLMALMDEAEILLMDEPTAALDPKSADELLSLTGRLIRELGITALLVTHNMTEAIRMGNRIIQLEKGSLIRDLNMEEKESLPLQALQQWFF
jgi:putative tryptophan/tyrosine transport system ATP-binding protein